MTTPVPVTKPKFGFNAVACLGYGILLVVAFALIVAVLLAKTGLVKVPLASRLYRGPGPTRIVTAGVTDPEAFSDAISAKVALAVKRGGPPPYRVTVEETELTAAFRGALASFVQGSNIIAERPQIVMTPTAIELSGRFVREGITFDILTRFEPRVEDGELRLNPISVQFGDYPISTSTAQNLMGYFFKRDFGAWRLDVGPIGLRDIRLGDGKVELFLGP
ncbi:hypothetical protein A3E39_02015 [Candidatus Uhrbacteria bacterium RIFCSPHIGHO2_12_FULL_60_25]|uniref:DUF2993 domain-containing protein n=1 Tax=Candidatus Uhrbacteria bacterium RIFCSPHIGHO2_12_FULL_60_25 TaxID=1802399 RepID=A0A1F7UKY5_9BACT|nr:MAG: hypothetical protein A3E39_02015 [Candidatus Uhrbacteria bacterium RIFCSPHIGHO2_12_FULL_60_25]